MSGLPLCESEARMTHQCPKCELRFTWQTELDDHCRTDHPAFHHDYPVGGVHDHPEGGVPREFPARSVEAVDPALAEPGENSSSILSTYWNER
jgi:hypothetical protein